MTAVKICGLTRAADAEAAIAAGADLVGFVLVPGTPRALDPAAATWVRGLAGAETVGVFRDADLDTVLRLRDRLRLDRVQLHGHEPDGWLDVLGSAVIRRVGTDGGVDWERLRWLAARCLPLIDPGAGDGRSCDWTELAGRSGDLDLALAGGLTPANVGEAIRVVRPALVDVSSGVERSAGVKDHDLVRAFCAAVRRADAAPEV